MVDPVERSDELDRQILAIPADRVFTKRAVVAGFVGIMLAIGTVLVVLLSYVADTRTAVKDRAVLEQRNVELETKTAQLEDVNGQAVDAIVQMSEQIVSLGGDPPEIVLRPTTTTTEPGG